MIQFNHFTLEYEYTNPFEGRSLSNEDCPARGWYYRLSRGREIDLEIAWVEWDNGERGVRLAGIERGPEALGRLFKGGRIGIYQGYRYGLPDGVDWVELRVMRRRGRDLPTAVNVPYVDIVRAAGDVDVWGVLSEIGAMGFGPRRHLLHDTGNRASTQIVTFSDTNQEVPVCAWALTKVLPIINNFRG